MSDSNDIATTIQEVKLNDFLEQFGGNLLGCVQKSLPPLFQGEKSADYDRMMERLTRQPYPQQRPLIHAFTEALTNGYRDAVGRDFRAAIMYGEMGTGKTMMGICVAYLLHLHGYRRCVVVCPPHLVYKWRREIKQTIPDAQVIVINGPDAINKLMRLRDDYRARALTGKPLFVIIGRVRMRLGFDWKPSAPLRRAPVLDSSKEEEDDGKDPRWIRATGRACANCGDFVRDKNGYIVTDIDYFAENRRKCDSCNSPLWTLKHRNKTDTSGLARALLRLPGIGRKTVDRLIGQFGEAPLREGLEDNLFELSNIYDEDGNFFFTEAMARRIERSMEKMEFDLGGGVSYQPTEWIKRYLPQNFFDVFLADEAHEYKGAGSAQGQAFGTLASSCRRSILLTGTLMGGYASDLFHLLWRSDPTRMVSDGYIFRRGSLGGAEMAFMRQHGVIKDIYTSRSGGGDGFTVGDSHRTARGSKVDHRAVKAPGFGPSGIMHYLAPITGFLRLREFGEDILPSYTEEFIDVEMSEHQKAVYSVLSSELKTALNRALAKGDRTLLGTVLQTTLAWPDCCFRAEIVMHPRGGLIASAPKIFGEMEASPKERAIIDLCLAERRAKRRVIVYTVYSGTRDTTARWRALLEDAGLTTIVLRSSVKPELREDWVLDQVKKGIDVLVCNPDLVKTGLDLLDFPTLIFANTGYSVYTLQQASRRSWRLGQKQPVKVFFSGYRDTMQEECLKLMQAKITVAQSTAGESPSTGLDILNQNDESVEIALSKKLLEHSAKH